MGSQRPVPLPVFFVGGGKNVCLEQNSEGR